MSPELITLRDLADPKQLSHAFETIKKHKGQAAGIDGVSYHSYSVSECWNMVRSLSREILDRSYRPAPTRMVCVDKPGGGQRELELQCIPDRLIAYRLQNVLRPFFNTLIPGLTQTVPKLYANLERLIECEHRYTIDEHDIQNCFPTTPIEPIIECHRDIIHNEDLLWLTETVIRGHEGQNRTTGLCQGSPYSPAALELLLHNHLDSRFETEYRGSRNLLRYVDNLIIACNDEHDCRQAIRTTQGFLSVLGLRLKHNENHPMDIRENTQRKILGMIPHWQDGKLRLSIPEDAYQNLAASLNEATYSRHPGPHAIQVAKGWIAAYGPTLVNQAVQQVVVDRVINISRSAGFLELKRQNLLETAGNAQRKWQKLRQKARTPTENC